MTPKDRLLEIMKLKALYLQKHLGIKDFFTEMDKQEILSWNEKSCTEILESMQRFTDVGTAQCCPWCRKYNVKCSDCSYARRHMPCNNKRSTYAKIVQRLKGTKYDTFIELPGLKEKLKGLIFENVNIKNKEE